MSFIYCTYRTQRNFKKKEKQKSEYSENYENQVRLGGESGFFKSTERTRERQKNKEKILKSTEKRLREKKYARVKRTQKKGKKRMQRTEKNNVEYKKM